MEAVPCRLHPVLPDNSRPRARSRVERMSRTLKEATVRRCHDGSHDELRRHLQLLLDAYNHGRCRRTRRGLTPHEL
jgi:hypothetical protein